MNPLRLYLVAGEASGDARGAELMRSLRERAPETQFFGRGGPQMRELAGDDFRDWVDRAGVIGILDVLRSYGYFRRQFNQTLAEIEEIRPDAVIPIDYPGFNLRLAKAIKERRPSQRVIYYISPQVWAWNRGRIPKMARVIDRMLCIFPFEKALYEQSGLRTVFVGHPMLDALGAIRTGAPRDPKLVGLLPGSRRREVRKIFPVMLAAAQRMKAAQPDLRFEAAAASEGMRTLMRETPGAGLCAIGLKNSHDLMQRAAAGMVASGTATLEATFFRLPYVLVYRVAALTYLLARLLVRVKWIGIANIIAGRGIVREFIQHDAAPEPIARAVLQLVNDPAARDSLVRELDAVIAQLGEPGASRRAAAAVLEELDVAPEPSPPRSS